MKFYLAVILPNLVALSCFLVFILVFGGGNFSFWVTRILTVFTGYFAGFIAKEKGWLYGSISAIFPVILLVLLMTLMLLININTSYIGGVINSFVQHKLNFIIGIPLSLLAGAILGYLGEKTSRRYLKHN